LTWKCPDTKNTIPGELNEATEEKARATFQCYTCELNCPGARYDGEDPEEIFTIYKPVTGNFYHFNAMCSPRTMIAIKVTRTKYNELLKQGKICHKCVKQEGI
jgi:hypothetical protein